jgi:hypothetical protein
MTTPQIRLRVLPQLLPQQIELQATATDIQWRYLEGTWEDLVAFDDINPDVSIGTVTSLAYGVAPTVANVGSGSDVILDFGLPSGQDGLGAWRQGTGVPSAGLGNDGDVYVDTASGALYTKTAGAWSTSVNIIGPQGAQGITGNDGIFSGAETTLSSVSSTLTVAHRGRNVLLSATSMTLAIDLASNLGANFLCILKNIDSTALTIDPNGAETVDGVATITMAPGESLIFHGDGTKFRTFRTGYVPGGTDVAVVDGGTGASTASGARTNLGLGTIATQDANNVSISGGTISGGTVSGVALTATNAALTTPTITLKQSASPTPTAEGDIQWDTDEDVIVVGNGSTQKRFWPGVPPGLLWGVAIANNGTDATNDIDFSAGFAADYTNASMVPCAALTKQLDANWAAGNNAGMRYSGAAIANTTYHLWAVWTAAGVQDYYADPSATAATVLGHLQAETGGSSYVYLRRIASIVRTGGAIKAFTQYGDSFYWTVQVSSVSNAAPGTSANTGTLTVPTGITVTSILTVSATETNSPGGTNYILVSSLAMTDSTPSSAIHTIAMQGNSAADVANSAQALVPTDTSAQIRYRSNGGSALTIYINSVGWIDTRGRLE